MLADDKDKLVGWTGSRLGRCDIQDAGKVKSGLGGVSLNGDECGVISIFGVGGGHDSSLKGGEIGSGKQGKGEYLVCLVVVLRGTLPVVVGMGAVRRRRATKKANFRSYALFTSRGCKVPIMIKQR